MNSFSNPIRVAYLLAPREFRRSWPFTTAAPAGAPTVREAPEHERSAEIPVADREQHPSVGSGMRDSTGISFGEEDA